jgi:hypothetical protein
LLISIDTLSYGLPGPQIAHNAAPVTAPYRILDNVEGDLIGVNTIPVRPLTLNLDGTELLAVNNHGNTLVRYDATTYDVLGTHSVPWGPVSVATWRNPALATFDNPDGRELALVVCQSSHVVAEVDPINGRTRRIRELPAEPADILVDHDRGLALISCPAADAVIALRLSTFTPMQLFNEENFPAFRVKHPQFLSFAPDGRLLVAPLLSGNNTTSGRLTTELVGRQAGDIVIDLNDPKYVPNPATDSLPDEDLIAIDLPTQSVEVAARGLGTILFAHGHNPATGQLWLLNTHANNAIEDKQSEPAIRGFSVDNQLTLATLVPGTIVGPDDVLNLDDTDPAAGVQYDPAKSIGQPYALAFDASGQGYVAGLLTDNVTVLDSTGDRVTDWKLTDGAIPRALLFSSAGSELFVYCWGNNTIEVWDPAGGTDPIDVLDLGYDPTPDTVKLGRAHFYDGARSLNGNASCASCHIEGRSDSLVWNLSGLPRDDKGPMLTQTLAGIDKVQPFHWRGERPGLIDFNPAFDGLLGGASLAEDPGGEFEQFEAFVFSIQNPANPNQDRRRVLNNQIQPPEIPGGVASAVASDGQDTYFDDPTFGALSCNDCHSLPTGSGNDHVVDDTVLEDPRRAAFKVPPFQELWRREQTTADIELYLDPDDHGQGSQTDSRAFLGAAITHAGLIPDLFEFLAEGFLIDDQEHANLASFLHQIDQGLAPAVHRVFVLNSATTTANQFQVQSYLLPQALARNCDIAAYGIARTGPGPTPTRWSWNRDDGLFYADLSSVPPRTLDDFVNAATVENHIFLGLPVGTAHRFAIDFDGDELVNRDELTVHFTEPFDPDSDDDGFPDGHEIEHGSDPNDENSHPVDQVFPLIEDLRLSWITKKVARLHWETSEPTRWRIEFSTTEGGLRCLPDPTDCLRTTDELSTTHTALLSDLLPSSNGGPTFIYDVRIFVTDAGDNTTDMLVPDTVQTDIFVSDPTFIKESVVEELTFTFLDRDSQNLDFDAEVMALVAKKRGGPPPVPVADRVVIASVIVDGVRSHDFVPTGGSSYKAHITRATSAGEDPHQLAADGPFLIGLETDGAGATFLSFYQPLPAGDSKVTLNIEALVFTNDVAAFQADLVETDLCVQNGGPFDCDTDGDGTPDSCCLDIPVTFAPRALTTWVMPATKEEARSISDPPDGP